ncbi:hypothetical protein [Singulisphaera sp. PoT]|uniref:hypothetical protein n=1 Tax=Singulisphaera sp. PoT TaxID=3411797 RepID=UPI003BF478B5
MGLGVYPIFEPSVAKGGFSSDGKFLLDEIEGLDGIASDHGVTPLSIFCDSRLVPDNFEGDPSELEVTVGDRADWFPIADGLQSTELIGEVLRTDSRARSRVGHLQEVLTELEALSTCLRDASRVATSFRFEVY